MFSTYINGAATKTAKYQYDTGAQLTKLLDWRHASNGIVFAYDNAGRLTKETDQVRSSRHIDYTYDSAGRVRTRGTVHALRSYLTPLGTVPPRRASHWQVLSSRALFHS